MKIDSTSKDHNSSFLDDQMTVCKLLEKDGVSAIEVSGSNFKTYKQGDPYYLENALKIKQGLSIPIIVVGGFRNSLQMNDALNKGIDLISVSRPFIADENFIEKLKQQQTSKCISCNQCFRLYKTEFKHCIFNEEINSQLYENFHKTLTK